MRFAAAGHSAAAAVNPAATRDTSVWEMVPSSSACAKMRACRDAQTGDDINYYVLKRITSRIPLTNLQLNEPS